MADQLSGAELDAATLAERLRFMLGQHDHFGEVARQTFAAAADRLDRACEWTPMDRWEMPGSYDTQCGEAFSFVEGDLKDNSARYCQYCGGTIRVKESAS